MIFSNTQHFHSLANVFLLFVWKKIVFFSPYVECTEFVLTIAIGERLGQGGSDFTFSVLM